jgi:hypothetical protein
MDEGVSWYSTGVDYSSFPENTIAALALVYHATSTGGEDLLKKKHMTLIITASVDYTPDGSWRPPISWKTNQRHIVDQARDWLEQATPKDQKGTVSPVIHVAANSFNIFTTTQGIYHWRRSLCPGFWASPPRPYLLPPGTASPKSSASSSCSHSWPARSWPSSTPWTSNFKPPSPPCP